MRQWASERKANGVLESIMIYLQAYAMILLLVFITVLSEKALGI